MAYEQRLQLRMSQKLVMTPTLQQAIRLLQLSRLELEEEIAQELVENPMLEEQDESEITQDRPDVQNLERDPALAGESETAAGEQASGEGEAGSDTPDSIDEIDIEQYFRDTFEASSVPNMTEYRELPTMDNQPAGAPDLSDHLLWQLNMQVDDSRLRCLGRVIIGNLDDDGMLCASDQELLDLLEELSQDDPEVAAARPFAAADLERVRRRISHFDPVGVATRDLKACLLTQLDHLGEADSPAAVVVAHHLDLLRQHKYQDIAKALGCDEAEARVVADVVRSLNPKPGAAYGTARSQVVTPDVVVVKIDGEYKVLLNDEGMPRLRISPVYRRILEAGGAASAGGGAAEATAATPADRETRSYVREKFRSALWFIKSLDQRQQTIHKVAESIVRHQRGFLDHGVEALQPLVLRTVADDVQMHESTISRVVTNKYMHTPRGLFELKFFFHSGLATGSGGDISSLAVKQKLKELIDGETPNHPLSDSELVKRLKSQDVVIARRTVAKYRDELGIAASPMRRRM